MNIQSSIFNLQSSIFFNTDGTIRKVTPTLRGVGVTPARNRIEIDRYSSISGGATIAFLDETAPFEGWKTIFPTKGASVDYNRVDFGNHPVSEIVVRAKSASAARIAVKAGGKLVAMFDAYYDGLVRLFAFMHLSGRYKIITT